MTFFVSAPEYETLLALAWSAPLNTQQIQRMVMPDRHPTTVQRTLRRLRTAAVIEAGPFIAESTRRQPVHTYRLWSLTREGFDVIHDDLQAPSKPAAVRWSLVPHDRMLSELLTCIIERGRHLLSGIYLDREVRLDGRRRRPICDAIVILRRDPGAVLQHVIPWVTGPPLASETIRGYAVEIDRGTEPLSTIRVKGTAYRDIWRDTSFYAQYGRLPVPLWVVPTERRLEAIAHTWLEAWPDGMWLIATEQGLQADVFEEWQQGQRRTRHLLSGWEAT